MKAKNKLTKWDKFSRKYKHVGYSYLGVSDHWKPIVAQAVIEIEKNMWVHWLPFFVKRWIHWLATGNSVVRIKYWWAYHLKNKLTHHQMITDIKDKYAGLRIYGYFNDYCNQIIKQAERDCDRTCEWCGSQDDVKVVDYGWMYNLCASCREKEENKHIINWYKRGWEDEYKGTTSTLPDDEPLIIKAYDLGVSHAKIGADVREEEILEIVKK